jgi:hypothetical protein
VVTAAWDRFLEEELVGGIMQTITKPSVSCIACYFVCYGKLSLLSHHPINQFNGNILKPTKGISNLIQHQHRFHKKMLQLVTIKDLSTPMLVNQESLILLQQEDKEEVSSSDEGVTGEEIVLGEYVHLKSKDTPCLSKLFGSETKVLKSYLNLLLLEPFKALGQETTGSIDFENKMATKAMLLLYLA